MKKVLSFLICVISFLSLSNKAIAKKNENHNNDIEKPNFEQHFEKMKQIVDDSFKQADTNGDENLDKTEHAKFIEIMKQKREQLRKQMEAQMPSSDEIFKMADANNDGFVTKNEMKEAKHNKHKCDKCKGENCKCN